MEVTLRFALLRRSAEGDGSVKLDIDLAVCVGVRGCEFRCGNSCFSGLL